MTSGHDDSDQALDLILAAGEAEELERVQDGLRLDAGLAAITQGNAREHSPSIDFDDSGEPSILSVAANNRASSQASLGSASAQHCVLFAVDVAGSARRDNLALLSMRRALWSVLTEAFEDSQVGWDNCLREDRGDGVLVIIPAGMQSAVILHPLLERLHAGLQHHNRMSSEVARIRLRVAIHSGLVHRDEYGLVGSALVHVFRLLDAPALKEALARSGDDLALIASDHFYDTVIRHGSGMVDPATFQPAKVEVKETRTRGWLHLPQSSPRVLQSHHDPRSAEDQIGSPGVEHSRAMTPAAPEIHPFRWIAAGR